MSRTQHTRRITALFALICAVLLFATPAAAKGRLVHVNGGGHALLTASTDPANDPEGLIETAQYPIQFSFSGVIAEDGSARGHINFVFTGEFASVWGAPLESGEVPADHVHLNGRVTAGTVAPDGTVTISGMLTESDFDRGNGKYFTVDDPFTITVGGPALERGAFILQWCLLPAFPVQVTSGGLNIRY